MKNILSAIIAIIVIGCVGFGAGWYMCSKEYKVTESKAHIIYDTMYVDHSDTVYVTKQAEIIYIPDTTVVTEYITIESMPAQPDPAGRYIARTEIEIGDYQVQVEYNTKKNIFNFNYHKFREVIAHIEQASLPPVEIGAQTFLYSGKRSMFGLAMLVGFPRTIDNLYLNFGAISDESIGIGVTYIF